MHMRKRPVVVVRLCVIHVVMRLGVCQAWGAPVCGNEDVRSLVKGCGVVGDLFVPPLDLCACAAP